MFLRRNRRKVARLGNRRRKIRTIKFGITVFVLLASVIGIVWLSHIEEVNIKTVVIVGNSVITKTQLEAIVEEQLKGTYGLLFPRTNILLFPKNSITADVRSAFDRIFYADIVVEDSQTIKLIVKERQPFALYCGDTFIDTQEISGQCYLLDERGFIFAKAPDFTGNIFFKYFGKTAAQINEDLQVVQGLEYMPQDTFRDITLFLESFDELEIEPSSFTRLNDDDFELRFKDGSYILFGVEQNLISILDNLQSVFESEVFLELENVQLDYIDLRFGNRIFYKFVD